MAETRTRPFALTMQAQRLDLHLVWGVLLALSIVLALLWVAWAFSAHVPVYVTSEELSFETEEPTPGERIHERQPKVLRARVAPGTEADALLGREALVFIHGDAGEQMIVGEVSEVELADDGALLVTLEGGASATELFERGSPRRVRIELDEVTPLELALPELRRLGWPLSEL